MSERSPGRNARGIRMPADERFDEDLEEQFLDELKARRRHNPVPTADRNSDVLPLTAIEPPVFERLVAEIVESQENPSVHFYGRSGQAQYGLDIVEERFDGTRVLYQVKRFERMTSRLLREAVLAYAGPPRETPDQLPERRFHPDTFVVVTSAKVEDDTALVDCISALQDEYRGDLAFDTWGAETVSRKLRNHRNLVAAVISDAWADEWCGSERSKRAETRAKRKKYVDDVLRAAMTVQFSKDNDVHFRQVELTGIAVESLFVDVPASSHAGSPADRLIQEINPHQQSGGELAPHSGAAQALLHPSWTDSTVIVGGPGQGKTTLLQFLCQYHRARCLEREEYSPIAAGLAPVTRVDRTPIKIELTEYAAWRRRLQSEPTPNPSSSQQEPDVALLHYIAETVAADAGRSFTHEDLALALATRPMIIALDGLDEIAKSSERTAIAQEVRITNSRIKSITRQVMVLVATRPGNVGNPIWRDINFSTLFLGELTPALRMKYLDRWTAQSKLTPAEVNDLRATFVESITYPHVVELAGNPMQLAILLNLMQRRTVLPERRTALYERYIEVFMDRESKSALVAANKDIIVAFHKLLGWHIHAGIEMGTSNGTISLTELRKLLTDYLAPRGYATALVEELFDSVTTRVLCLVQRELDSNEFQFEVQPLREYFAAEHIYDVSPNATSRNNRQACLAELIRRPYWTNVMRFFAGKFSSGEVPAIPYALRDLQHDKAIKHQPVTRTAAKHLLDDRVLGGQLELVVTDMVKVLLDGPGVVLAVDGVFQQDESIIRFQERGGRKQAIEVLLSRLKSEKAEVVQLATAQILRHLGAQRAAAETCWNHTDADASAWVKAAAYLGALDNPTASQRQILANVTSRLSASEATLLAVLVQSGVQVLDDALVSACLSELRRSSECPDPRDTSTFYRRLAAVMSVDRLYEHRRAQSTSTRPAGTKRHRQRVRSTATKPAAAALQALGHAHTATDWTHAATWHHLLDATEEVAEQDCWTMRERVLALPDNALDTGSATASLANGTTWRGVAQWRTQVIANRSDADWLSAEAAKCTDSLARMSFVAYVVTTSKTSTVEKLVDSLGAVLEPLEAGHWSAMTAALQRYGSHAVAPSEINMSEALRLQRIQPSPRLAVLLWPLSNEGTRARLARCIAPELGSMWGCGSGVTNVLTQFLEIWDKKLPVNQFRGSRTDLPPGTLPQERLAQMTFPQADNILAAPHEWPTDLVRTAVDRLSGRLSSQTPVMQVAATADWRT